MQKQDDDSRQKITLENMTIYFIYFITLIILLKP